MELRQLEYAVVLADELHFGRAAARLHIVQSGLSQQVKKLEREVGVALFSRSTHHVALTPAGEAFVEEARAVLAAAERLPAVARSASGDREIRVGVSDAGLTDLHALVAELRRRLPGVGVRELDGAMPFLASRLLAGELDLAIGLPSEDPGLSHEPLRTDRLGVCLHADHPLAQRSQVAIADVAQDRVVLPAREVAADYVDNVASAYARAGVPCRTHPDARSTPASALQVVARGEAVIVLPELTMLPPGVRWLPFSDEHAVHPWCVLWRRGPLSPLVETALDVVREHAADRGWTAA